MRTRPLWCQSHVWIQTASRQNLVRISFLFSHVSLWGSLQQVTYDANWLYCNLPKLLLYQVCRWFSFKYSYYFLQFAMHVKRVMLFNSCSFRSSISSHISFIHFYSAWLIYLFLKTFFCYFIHFSTRFSSFFMSHTSCVYPIKIYKMWFNNKVVPSNLEKTNIWF